MIRRPVLFSLLAASALLSASFATAQERLLTLGTSVTETVFALGAGAAVVGRDTTSTYPVEVTELPDVGYIRQLAPEGLLSVRPDMIIAEEDAGPPETIEGLKAAALPWITLPKALDAATVVSNIRTIGTALGKETEAQALITEVEAQLAAAQAASDATVEKKRVLFILSAQGGRINAAGTGTSADAMLTLAGAINVAGDVEGYKQLTDEAIALANPDLIVMMDRGPQFETADADLFAMPALAATTAGQNKALLHIDGTFLLGFGPRTGQAALELHEKLYPSTTQ